MPVAIGSASMLPSTVTPGPTRTMTDRIPMSVGQATPRAIGFMHIPKTGGITVQHAFRAALGAAQCRSLARAIGDEDFADCRFIAGHLTLNAITPRAWRFTFLRQPVAQLASHLRWLDHYNQGGFIAEAWGLSAAMRHVIVEVGRTDFTSPRALDALFDWMPPDAPARLADIQCEMLTRRPDAPPPATPAELAEEAIGRLTALDFVGVIEHASRDLARLFQALDLPDPPLVTRQNERSSARQIDLTDPAIHATLARRVQADLLLYAHVTGGTLS